MLAKINTERVETSPGMVFDVSVCGSSEDQRVLLLHGFGVSRFSYSAQVVTLAEAGYFAAAPNQRGYSPDARPDPADFTSYRIELLIADALDIAKRLWHSDRLHLVGHDWGASLAWEIADKYPERLGSLTILSRPHPQSFNRALMLDSEQSSKSSHHRRFLDPKAGADILADNVKWLRTRLTKNGVPLAAIERHLSVVGNPEAMEAALAWYRARGSKHTPVGRIKVPTLYVWGDSDDTVGRFAAEGTREFIDAPYQFAPLAGGGHFVADQFPDRVSQLLLDHLTQHTIS